MATNEVKPSHGNVLNALLRAAQEELDTRKVIIVAEINGATVVAVSEGAHGAACGILAEALLHVDGPIEDAT
jgi:hypothetical protein